MSRVTLVSTLPFKLIEEKPGLDPSRYEIPAADFNDIAVKTIKDGFHLFYVPMSSDKAPPMKIIDAAEQIAASLIQDYISAKLAIDLENEAVPGLFWVPDFLSKMEVNGKYPEKVKAAKQRTIKWFENLVKLADDDWTKTHQHRSISGEQHSACKYLGLSKEWNFVAADTLANLCWACKSTINPEAIICPTCKAVLKKAEFEAKKGQFSLTV